MSETHNWYDFAVTVAKGLGTAFAIGKLVVETVKWVAKQRAAKDSAQKRIAQLEAERDALGRALEASEERRKRSEDGYKKWTARDRIVQYEREMWDREHGITG